MPRAALSICALFAVFLCRRVSALQFEVAHGQTKCVSEDIDQGVLVLGEYGVASGDVRKISVKVKSPNGDVLYAQEGVEDGHFGFTTKESGEYKACFWSRTGVERGQKVHINLEWKTGVHAKDWTAIAKKENLAGMELELRQLEDTVKGIHEEMLYMRAREQEMRDMNERTNSQVAWLSLLSLIVCISLAVWQLYYLKRFFERKKVL
eukprot:jgi/Mesvir1/26460/Mv16135-RA.1